MHYPVTTAVVVLLLTRIYVVLSGRSPKSRKRRTDETCKLAVFLGSGGHTSEALILASSLDFSRYSPRVYIVSEGDALSTTKAVALEASRNSPTHVGAYYPLSFAVLTHHVQEHDGKKNYTVVSIPRARRVHQPIWTVLPTVVYSLAVCIYLVTIAPLFETDTPFADLLILNGPGTCVTLCAAVVVNKLLGLPYPKTIYIESYARVRTLSLSGKILRFFVDRFLVQWPSLLSGGGMECHGCLV